MFFFLIKHMEKSMYILQVTLLDLNWYAHGEKYYWTVGLEDKHHVIISNWKWDPYQLLVTANSTTEFLAHGTGNLEVFLRLSEVYILVGEMTLNTKLFCWLLKYNSNKYSGGESSRNERTHSTDRRLAW